MNKKSETTNRDSFKPMPMVGWYDARQLFVTGIKTIVSSVFGAYSDRRELQACLSKTEVYDYSDKKELWIDYLSDTADGFDSTFTMATLLSEGSRTFSGQETLRGDILVLGGDQVYPVATREEYRNRFRGPFEAACHNQPDYPKERKPDMFAIPGNHDWYDGLTNFIKLFCQNRSIGDWQTRQGRSYFAIKLPGNWWIWGIDIQLAADIDYPQLQYFDEVATTHMNKGDKVILFTAEPSWVFTSKKGHPGYDNLKFFEQRYIIDKGFQLAVTMAGDLHHYSRYTLREEGKEYHKLTAGGGGAFLHPTHNLKDKLSLREGAFELKETFPKKKNSRKLALWNLAFPWFNYNFAVFMGIFYLLFSWLLQVATKNNDATFIHTIAEYIPSWENLGSFITDAGRAVKLNPSLLLIITAVIAGITLFTDTKSSRWKLTWMVGTIHGVMHIFNGFLLIWIVSFLTIPLKDESSFWFTVVFSLEVFIVGGLTGCMVMGTYLLLTNLLLGIHDNEAFSSLKWEGYKNFLRLHIKGDELTIYPIGVRTAVKWKKYKGQYVPDKAVEPFLADEIIKVKIKEHEEATQSIPVVPNS